MNVLMPFIIFAFLANAAFLYLRDKKIHYHKIPLKFKIVFLGFVLVIGTSIITGKVSVLSLDTLFLVSFGLFTLTSGNMK